MIVQLQSVMNNNGPTTAYQIAVVNEDMSQALQTENLKAYSKAMEEGLAYYVTAEILPQVYSIGSFYKFYYCFSI